MKIERKKLIHEKAQTLSTPNLHSPETFFVGYTFQRHELEKVLGDGKCGYDDVDDKF